MSGYKYECLFVGYSCSIRNISEEDYMENRMFQLAHWEMKKLRQRINYWLTGRRNIAVMKARRKANVVMLDDYKCCPKIKEGCKENFDLGITVLDV